MHTCVLLVEDDVALRDSVAECLADEGYPVAAATDGSEALEYLRSHERPCLILLDLWLPKMTGEAFRAIQLSDPVLSKIPVVVVSAATDAGARAAAMGAAGFLRKPLELDSLLSAVAANC